MLKNGRALLQHLVILICNMYIVFFLIDCVNPAMNFIDNGLTKGLLLILCLAAGSQALPLALQRRFKRRRIPRRVRPQGAGRERRVRG